MDERIESGKPAPEFRRFRLTPLAQGSDEVDEERSKGSSRRKLIAGGAAVPIAMTVRGRRAFANSAACTVSMMLSTRTSTPQTGQSTPCSMPANGTSNSWEQAYTTLDNDYSSNKFTYKQLMPGQNSSSPIFLGNPSVTNSFPFTIPSKFNGVSFSCTSSTFSGALQGTSSGVELTVKVVDSSNKTKSGSDQGQFFAQAIAALLNAAFYGSTTYGQSYSQIISYINSVFTSMQNKAGTMTGQSATTIYNSIFGTNVAPTVNGVNITTQLEGWNTNGA